MPESERFIRNRIMLSPLFVAEKEPAEDMPRLLVGIPGGYVVGTEPHLRLSDALREARCEFRSATGGAATHLFLSEGDRDYLWKHHWHALSWLIMGGVEPLEVGTRLYGLIVADI